MSQSKVLVLGAGKVGKSVAELLLLAGRGDYSVTLADARKENLTEAEANLNALKKRLAGKQPVEFATKQADLSNPAAVKDLLEGHQYVICMLPFNLVEGIAAQANEMGVHYFDVTEDVETTDKVRAIAADGKAKVALVPQCGLAPGYIAIAANYLARDMTEVHDLVLRVGALSQFPTNALRYNITWSTAGVINEYCEPCNVMMHGKMENLPALEGLETFSFEGIEYEAFYTSGGVGSLIETLRAEKKTSSETRIAYKTIRYPGHCELMKFLLQNLRLAAEDPALVPQSEREGRWTHPTFNRKLLVDLFDHALPRTLQDVVVIFANAVGVREGRREQVSIKKSIRATEIFGRVWPAIELTTAAGVCAMVDLHRSNKLPRQTGFIRQEEVSLEQFEATIFGSAYVDPAGIEAKVLK